MLWELRRGDVAVGWVREGFLEEAESELNLELLKKFEQVKKESCSR